MFRSFLQRFSMFNLVVITMMAALGIAVKPVVVPLAHIITGPLYLPGGVVAGGFYMLWIVLGYGLIKKTGAATLIGMVQAILVIALGIIGTHGALSLLTYLTPGIAVDLLYIILPRGPHNSFNAFMGGAAANITGTVIVSTIFFRLPWIPLLLGLSVAALSGGLGGLIALGLLKQLKKFNLGEV